MQKTFGGIRMKTIEIEQLKNQVSLKIGLLENKIKTGEVTDDTSLELVGIFKEYEENGTTIEELKLLFEDVQLALS